MRKIYDSDALRRDDDPFTPAERDDSARAQAMRWINATALSRLVTPSWLRALAISVDVSSPRETYAIDEPVPFTVTMRNSMPFPITIETRSPLLWTWAVDGLEEASHVQLHDPPERRGELRFDRGERKRFRKRWPQRFRVSRSEWAVADPGEYTISAALNLEHADEKGLAAETTIRLDSAE